MTMRRAATSNLCSDMTMTACWDGGQFDVGARCREYGLKLSHDAWAVFDDTDHFNPSFEVGTMQEVNSLHTPKF